MTTFSKTIALALALGTTAVGCATNGQVGGGDDTGGGPGSDDVGVPLTPVGKYAISSNFDIATNMPGKVGDVVNIFIQATDDPADPSQYLIQTAINGISNQAVKDALTTLAPVIASYVQDKINDVAPQFVSKMLLISNHFGDVLKNYGLTHTLDVKASGAGFAATDSITGLQFKIDNVELQFPFTDYALPAIDVPNVAIGLDQTGKFTIAQHAVPVSLGRTLRIALDELIIPSIDPSATNLNTLLKGLINCHNLGIRADEATTNALINANTIETACNIGIDLMASIAYSKLEDVDTSAFKFNIDGTAKAIDKNRDSYTDDLQRGAWAGTMEYAGTPAPLATATFFGMKI